MSVLYVSADGKKIAKRSAEATNSGTSAADVNVTVTFSELEKVLDVVALYGDVAVTENAISRNQVTVTAKNVPAGATVTVYVVVVGY